MVGSVRQRDSVMHPTSPSDEHSDISHRSCPEFSTVNSDDAAADDDSHHHQHHHRSTNWWENFQPGSISNLCSATLGAGALSLPYAISLTGIVIGVVLLMISAYLTIISVDVIIDACVRTQLFKYEDVAERLVGRRAGRVLEASLLIFCFGVRT